MGPAGTTWWFPCPRGRWWRRSTARCSPTSSRPATGGGRPPAVRVAGATAASSRTGGGRPASPSRARSARRRGSGSSSSSWPTSRWSASRTWARARSSPASPRPSRRSPTTRSPRSSRTSGSYGSTTVTSWSPTSPVSSRGPARARAWATGSSATSSGPGCWPCSSTSHRPPRPRRPNRRRCCCASSAPTVPSCSSDPASSSGAGPTSPTGRGVGPARRSSAVTGDGVAAPRWAGWPSWSAGPGRPRASPRRSWCTGRFPRGSGSSASDDGSFRVVGRQAERAVALSDITNPDALAYVAAPARQARGAEGPRAGRGPIG